MTNCFSDVLDGKQSYITVGEAILDIDQDVANQKQTNHSERVTKRFEAMDEGCGMESVPEGLQISKQSQQKLDRSEPAPTMLTLPDDFVHPTEPRIPTVREMARLQSFPDWFVFKGPRRTGGSNRQEGNCQYQQVGNAAPPQFVESVVGELP